MRKSMAVALIVGSLVGNFACSRSKNASVKTQVAAQGSDASHTAPSTQASSTAPEVPAVISPAVIAAPVVPHACDPAGATGFISGYFTCQDQLQDYPISLAQVEGNLYLVYFQGTAIAPEIIPTKDKGNNLIEPAFNKMNEHMSIAEYQGKLYVAWADGGDTRLNFGRAETNSSGVVTSVTFLGKAQNQGTDGTPAIAPSPDGSFFMGWQSKDNPPRLNFVKFAFPSSPPTDLVAGFHYHPELIVKNAHQAPVSIAMIGRTPYVTYEVDHLACQIVKFSEDGQTVQGEWVSGEGCRAPSIATIGNALYLACLGKDDNLHLLQVALDASGSPTGFARVFPNPNQFDEAGPALTSTPDGLMIVWREKEIHNRLRIGSVRLN